MADVEPDLYRAVAGKLNTQADLRDQPEAAPMFDGAVYRRVFVGMEIPGFPERVQVGDVVISQHVGPVMSHVTDLRQRAGYPLLFDKCMDREIEVGAGQWLTVCTIEVRTEMGEVRTSLRPYRERAEAAVGLLAAVLDERIARTPLTEDLILTMGGEPVAAQDVAENIRHFLPYGVTQTEVESFASAAEPTTELELALRWYLRGAQAGPGKDGVVFHWIAIEAMVRNNHPKAIEAKLIDAGWDMAHLGLSVGEILGVRSRVVHATESSRPLGDELIARAYRDAETMARVLLRHELALESTWPAPPDVNLFREPWNRIVGETWGRPHAVEWHTPPLPAIPGSQPPGIAWERILPASQPPAEIAVDGGTIPQQHRLRRWVGMAMTFFQHHEPIACKIRRLEGSDGKVSAEKFVIASTFLSGRDPVSEIRLGLRVHVFLASYLLYRAGISTDSVAGALIHGFFGGWAKHRVFVTQNGLGEDFFTHLPLTGSSDARIVGEHLGAVAAGGSRSEGIVGAWLEETELLGADKIADRLIALGRSTDEAPELLNMLVEIYDAGTLDQSKG